MRKLCLIFLMLLATLTLAACGGGSAPNLRPPTETIPTQSPSAHARMQLVYQTKSGYLVPTWHSVPDDEGLTERIRRLAGEPNADFFAQTSLASVLPSSFDLSATQEGATVTVDLTGNWQSLTATAERNMVRGVVSTALSCEGVSGVKLTFNGQPIQELKHATKTSGVFRQAQFNIDTSVFSLQGSPVTLYFMSDSLLVPVHRYLQNPSTLQVAMAQLCAGPSSSSKLSGALPAGTVVRYASLQDGIATIDFSTPLLQSLQATDGGASALQAICLTAQQFASVQQVKLLVEGQPFEPEDFDLTATTFANEYEN